jgi:hypothetical protein
VSVVQNDYVTGDLFDPSGVFGELLNLAAQP